METQRLFIALPLPAEVRDSLVALYEPVRGVHWTRPEQLHLTLCFLGDIELPLAGKLESVLSQVSVERFFLPVEGVGVFPSRGPTGVIWAGIGRGHPRLHQLRKQIDEILLQTGVPLDVRVFHPHITLARLSRDAPASFAPAFCRHHREFEGSLLWAEEFQLYSSELQPAGAVHTLRRSYPLMRPPHMS